MKITCQSLTQVKIHLAFIILSQILWTILDQIKILLRQNFNSPRPIQGFLANEAWNLYHTLNLSSQFRNRENFSDTITLQKPSASTFFLNLSLEIRAGIKCVLFSVRVM